MTKKEVAVIITRIAVVDDDEVIAVKISRLIEKTLDTKKEITTYCSSKDFFNEPNKFDYDLVLLDIDMPDINGFELAANLKTVKPDITVIFVSNMDHLVFKAIEFRPFRFIRKNLLSIDLPPALNAYMHEFESHQEQFLIRGSDFESYIPVDDIIYFESMGHDIYVKTHNSYVRLRRSYDYLKNMKEIARQFEPKGFLRVHRSFLVNWKYIYVISRKDILLKNNEKIYINPHNVNEIKEMYLKYLMTE